MYEYGMSALVLKICQEYAQATGLNFPPCTQQEINAIAQWVNTHAVKDFKISQEGNVLTFTFYQDKEVTFTVELPEEYVLNVDDLYTLVKGSSTVVVDKSSDGKTLEIRLDKSQEVQYITLSPDSATQGTLTVDQFTTLQLNKGNCIILNNEIYRLADNQHTTGVISYVHTGWDSNIVNKSINITVSTRAWTMVKGEASGGGKLYRHAIYIEMTSSDGAPASYNGITIRGAFYSSSPTKKTIEDFKNGEYLGIREILHAEYNGNINVPANNYVIMSKDDNIIGLFLLTSYEAGSTTGYGYSSSPTSFNSLTEWKLVDNVTEV